MALNNIPTPVLMLSSGLANCTTTAERRRDGMKLFTQNIFGTKSFDG